jgi:acyl-coenzyme A synthetase/AMP-(fatty) acid ligase
MASTTLPLLQDVGARGVVAYLQREPVSLTRFLADVAAVAAVLPERDCVLNLCADRYRFSVGLAAALARRQVTLLPPDLTPELIAQLARRHPGLYSLADRAAPDVALERLDYPETAPAPHTELDPLIPSYPADQLAALVFTSGSTGEPRPHAKTWGSLVMGSAAAGAALGIARWPGASLLATVPAQHMYGLESSILLPWQHGLALDGQRPLFPADIAERLYELPRPRVLVTTPVHLRALLSDIQALPELDLVVCATAPLAPQLAAAAERRFAAPLLEIYGCTEAGQLATRRTVEGATWSTLLGISLVAREEGVSALGGPVQKEALLQDVVELAGPNRFLLHGRIADLINIAGKRTSLANLNFQLNSIPGVTDGIFVMPEEADSRVTRLMAFAVAPDLSEEDLMAALRLRIDAAFLPRPLIRVAALPRNPTGKLPRAALARLVADSLPV